MRTISCLLIASVMSMFPLSRAVAATLVEVARVGGADERPEYQFGEILCGVVAADGSVFTWDYRLNQVRHHDADGTFLADVGRAGMGEGEYGRVVGMTILPLGELVVLDLSGRVTFFDVTTGRHTRAIATPGMATPWSRISCDETGFIYWKDTDDCARPDAILSFFWSVLDSSGTEVGRIPIPEENAVPRKFIMYLPEGIRSNFPVATLSAWSPRGYLVSGRNDRYAFDIQRPEGVIHVEQDIERVRLNQAERAEWLAVAELQARDGERPCEVPETKPVFRSIDVDTGGRIWVNRYVQARKAELPPPRAAGDQSRITWREPNTWDIFDDDGIFLGTIEMPMLTAVVAFRGDDLWGVHSAGHGQELIHWRIGGLGE